jgi:energy-coupling factor transport system permease protein
MSRLAPQTALLLALQAAVLALLLERPLNLALLAALAGAAWAAAGGWRRWRAVLLLLLLGTWGMTLTQGLFYAGEPRTRWFTILSGTLFPFGAPPGLHMYQEGLLHGAVQSLRIDALVLAGAAVLARYDTDRLAAGLRALRCPPPLAFLLTLSLRFVPLAAGEARAIWAAQRLRGLRLLPPQPWRWPGAWRLALRAWLLPLLAAQVRIADEIAAALLSRGWSPFAALPAEPAPSRERWLWVGGALLLAGLAAAQALTHLYRAGLYAQPGLFWLYDFSQRYL